MSAADIAQLVLRLVLAALFLGMGVLHFVPASARGMAAIIPPRLRNLGAIRPIHLVWLTGLCEIAGGIGLLLPPVRLAAGVALVVFLIAVFPANAYAARHPERFGRAAVPFWPRLIAQLALVALVILAIV